MHIGEVSTMCLFQPTMNGDSAGGKRTLTVKYVAPKKDPESISFDLGPEVSHLKPIHVSMHGSETDAYRMDDRLNDWFSKCFGFPVVLAYLGPHHRPVLFPNLSTKPQTSGWLSSVTSKLAFGDAPEDKPKITFADAAAYLVVTEESLADVSARLPEEVSMDVTKFRPNIVISGAPAAWDEDFWGAITIEGAEATVISLPHNCYRCQSINVNYETGEYGKDESDQVLKKLQKDRRVDRGKKWSAVFGRYGFLEGQKSGMIRVGDEVSVSKRNTEHTAFGKLFNICSTQGLCADFFNRLARHLVQSCIRRSSILCLSTSRDALFQRRKSIPSLVTSVLPMCPHDQTVFQRAAAEVGFKWLDVNKMLLVIRYVKQLNLEPINMTTNNQLIKTYRNVLLRTKRLTISGSLLSLPVCAGSQDR